MHLPRIPSPRSRLWVLYVCFLAVLSFVFIDYGQSKRYQHVLTIGVYPKSVHEYLFEAQEEGLFEDLLINFVAYACQDDLLKAFEDREIDGIISSLADVALAQSSSARQLSFVLVTGHVEEAPILITRPSIQHLSELRGATVGLESGSSSLELFADLLERADLPLEAVSQVTLQPSELSAALASRQVDAIIGQPPLHYAEEMGIGPTIFRNGASSRDWIYVLALDASLSKAYTSVLSEFFKQWDLVASYANHSFGLSKYGIRVQVPELEAQSQILALQNPNFKSSFFQTQHLLKKLSLMPKEQNLEDSLNDSWVRAALEDEQTG